MTSSSSILIGALTLGAVGGSIPGPVLTSIFTEILQTNLRRSMKVLFWAMIVETCVRTLTLLLLSVLPLDGVVFHVLSLIGAAILLWIASSVWNMRSMDREAGTSFSYGKLALMIICNGMLWTYWITVCAPNALELGRLIPLGQYLFLAAFELGWFVSTFLVACLFASFRRVLSHPRVMPILFKLFALVFVYFAVKMMWGSVEFFTS